MTTEIKSTSTKLYSPTLDNLKMGRLRPNQAITYPQIEFVVETTGMGAALGKILFEEAINNITIYERNEDGSKGEIHPQYNEIVHGKEWDDYISKLIDFESYEYCYGWGVLALFERKGDMLPLLEHFGWQAGSRANINFKEGDQLEGAELFEIDNIEVEKKIHGSSTHLTATITNLDTVYVAMHHSNEFNRVIPPILPIVRTLYELMSNGSQAGLWVRRVGSGIHMVLVDASLLSSNSTNSDGDSFEQDVVDWLDKLDEDSYFIGPKEINGVETTYQLYTGESSIDFTSPETLQMTRVSAPTSIPESKLRGQPTAFKSAEVQQSNFMMRIEKIQKSFLKKLTWLLEQAYQLDNFIAEIDTFEEMTSMEKVDLRQKQYSALQTIAPIMDRFGLTPQVIFADLEIDMEIDDTILQNFEQRREELNNQLTDGSTDDRDDGDGDPEQDEQRPSIGQRIRQRFGRSGNQD